ncbi:MAG: TonB-dependent siderophore receptor [Pseudomonadota bacterium]
MRKVHTSLSILALCITNAYAQTDSVDEQPESEVERINVVGQPSIFGATKSNIPLLETPRSLSIITSDEFLDRGALVLSNTVNYTAGVTGNAFGPATRSDSFSIRGLDAPQYQDNLQVQFGFFNNARADVYTLEQVEILKGPASVLYGQAAPGGIVSTISKVASANNLDKELVLNAGSHERYQASVDLGVDLSGNGNWTGRFVGIYRDSDTQVDFVNDDVIVLAPSITYQNDTTRITALFNYTDRKSDTNAQFLPLTATACQSNDITISDPNLCAAAPAQQVDSSVYVGDPSFNRFDSESTTISLFASHDFNDWLTFNGTVRYRDNEADYQQTWISFLGDGNPRLLPDGTAIVRSFFGGPAGSDQFAFDLRLNADFETGAFNHQLLAGVNYQDVDTFSNQAFVFVSPTAFNIFNPVYDGSDIPDPATLDAARFLSEDNTKASDVYLVDHITYGNLILNLGIRFSSVDSEDASSDQSDNETPISVGALYQTDFGLNPYISYSESFRATVGTDVITGTSLLPRKGEQVEVGLKYQPKNSTNVFIVSYFDLEEDNLVDFLANGSTQPGLSITADGFEVEALVNVGDFSFDFDYLHLNADEVAVDGTETPRPSEPSNTASLWASWEPKQGPVDGLRIGAGVRYVSSNESNGASLRIETDAVTVVDFLASYQFNENLVGSLNIRNLTDKEYFSTCLARGDCFPGEERTIVGTLSYSF